MAGTLTKISGAGAARPLRALTSSDYAVVFGTFLFDTSYTTGGMSLPASSLGLKDVQVMVFSNAISGSSTQLKGVLSCTYDYSTQKVIAYGGSGTALIQNESATTTNLSAFTCRFVAIGKR